MSKLSRIRKPEVVAAIEARLIADRDELIVTQRRTQEGAFHEDNRPENDKDMRSTEVSYLARGLAERVAQAMEDVAALSVFEPRTFSGVTPIGASALVLLEDEDTEELSIYFITPVGGGLRLSVADETVFTLSPQSPLGQELQGLRQGDELSFVTPRGRRDLLIVEVC